MHMRRQTRHAPTAKLRPTAVAGHVPLVKPGTYADGLPLHDIQYLCCKLVLKPNHLKSRQSLFEFADVLREPADENKVTFSVGRYKKEPIQIREVLFADTADFRLYKNAFILRRRIRYEDGFPVEDPEIVFKFRHPDIQKTAEMDVRPQVFGDHKVKFKCQALPLKDRLGGVRLLFSHNVQFPRSNINETDVLSMSTVTKIFPVLERIRKEPHEKLALVSETIIEEVLQNIGTLDFGGGTKAKVNVGVWRTRGEHRPVIGEFGFQLKVKDRKDLDPDTMKRIERFFIAIQYAAQTWIALDATKTAAVYRLRGQTLSAHD